MEDGSKPRYKPDSPPQDVFVPLCFDKQILPGTFEYALHHLLEHTVDLSAFDDHYNNHLRGARAYHPKVLLKLVLFGYARGLTGSRRIELACRENVQFMALGGEAKPDHATIAAFISRSPDAIKKGKHQIICEAQAHGVPQEQELLQPILGDLQQSFSEMGLSPNILAEAQLSADAGFHSGDNLAWLEAEQCDAYVADNRFRKRDPRFADADKYKPPKPQPSRFRPADFHYDPARQSCTCPAGKALYRNGANISVKGRSGIKFTAPKSACQDCHLRKRCLRNEQQASPRQVVFFREPENRDNPIERMKQKIDSPVGRQRYSRRLGTVEPPFGNLRYHKGLDRFTLRGQEKVDAQWKLYAMVHNIEKLAHYASW